MIEFRLPLTRGRSALVDADAFERLRIYKWYWVDSGKSNGYAMRWLAKNDPLRLEGCAPERYLHHDVLGVPSTVMLDHRNGDGLDCRAANLRVADKSKNGANRPKFAARSGRRFTSRYKGVIDRSAHLANTDRPWLARIRVNYKLIHLGRYATETEAARAYDAAAAEHFGEFARLNFPTEIS